MNQDEILRSLNLDIHPYLNTTLSNLDSQSITVDQTQIEQMRVVRSICDIRRLRDIKGDWDDYSISDESLNLLDRGIHSILAGLYVILQIMVDTDTKAAEQAEQTRIESIGRIDCEALKTLTPTLNRAIVWCLKDADKLAGEVTLGSLHDLIAVCTREETNADTLINVLSDCIIHEITHNMNTDRTRGFAAILAYVRNHRPK